MPLNTVRAPKTSGARFFSGPFMLTLDRFLILSRRLLHHIVKVYQEYFNHARPNQGIGQRFSCQLVQGTEPPKNGKLISRPVLGGLYHDYQRQSQERQSYPPTA
jgi:putative transposase